MKLGSFTQKTTKTQGPTIYTSTTVCSLCIVELQQRHSELVNGAITSNNMSYLTKHCHTVIGCVSCQIKKSEFLMLLFLFSFQASLEALGISCCIKGK